MGLEALTPELQIQYGALIPEIERATRAKNQARGMFYSGQAGDEEVRAKAALLAELASKSSEIEATKSENAKNREAQAALQREEVKASKRNALLGTIGTGVGSAAGLTGLALMNRMPGQIVAGGPTGYMMFDGKKLNPIPTSELAGTAASAGATGTGGVLPV